jgi:class 3 adenylate cyclase/DNA-binding response OmpR family regulator
LSGETVMVVDDSTENCNLITRYVLEPNNYVAVVAYDGREALELMHKHHPDLVLLDYNMPRMDGVGFLRALRKRRIEVPVILMTADGSENLAVEVFRLGVRNYLIKPFEIDEMEDAIARHLTEVRLRREKEALTERVIQANRDLQLRVQELNVFHSIGKSVTGLMDLEKLLPRVLDAAIQMTHAQQGFLYLIEDDALVCRAKKLIQSIHRLGEKHGSALAERVMQTGQPILLGRQQIDKMKIDMAMNAAYVPMVLGNTVIGVLGVENVTKDSGVFSQHDSALLSTLSDYAAIAISNSRNYEAVKLSKEREKRIIRGTFERFVSPSVVEKVLDKPESLQLGGHRREISVLFADIRGYTAWSENAPPEEIVETLNHYLSLAAEVILAWEGTLDKFFGDGLMAVFNAPNDQADHIHRAADAALALMKASNEVSEIHGHRLSYSIGVNVGEAVVGYIGTDRAVNYTAIGDTVNLTKRLQEYAAPGQILVAETVIHRLGGLVQARPLGEVKVKGRRQPTQVYELNGLHYPSDNFIST